MSQTDDTQPTRGRPVLKRIDIDTAWHEDLIHQGKLWIFCGEYDASEQKAADAAKAEHGPGIYKVFPSGSWPGGYLRD